jgi:hypothetical protein
MTKGWRAGTELPPSVEKRLAPPVTMGALSVAAIAVLTKKTRFALGAVVLTAVYGYLTGASAGSADRKSGDESHLVELLSSKPWLWQRAEKALDRACGKLETLAAIQMISSNELELYPSLAQCRVPPGRR